MRVGPGAGPGTVLFLAFALSPATPGLRAQARSPAVRFTPETLDVREASSTSKPGARALPAPAERSTRRGAVIGAIAGSAAGAVGGAFLGLLVAAFCESDCTTSPGWYAAGLGLAGAVVGAAGGAAAGAIVGATIPERERAPAAPRAARRGTIGRVSLAGGAALGGGEAGPAAAADFGATWRRLFVGFEGGAYGLGSAQPWDHAWTAGGVGRADMLGGRVRGYLVAGSGFYSWSYPGTSTNPARLNLLGYSVGLGVHGAGWRGLGFRVEGRRHDNLSRSGPVAGELGFRALTAGLSYSW